MIVYHLFYYFYVTYNNVFEFNLDEINLQQNDTDKNEICKTLSTNNILAIMRCS